MSDDFISLTDLAPITAHAELSVGKMRIYPLGAGDIAQLMILFPCVRAVLRGDEVRPDELVKLAMEAPDAIPFLVSSACGLGGQKGMSLARNLAAADQMRVIRKALDISFPGGSADFFGEVDRLLPAAPEPQSSAAAPEVPDVVESVEDLIAR